MIISSFDRRRVQTSLSLSLARSKMGYDQIGAPRGKLSTHDYAVACGEKSPSPKNLPPIIMDEQKVHTWNIVSSVSLGCPLDLVVLMGELNIENCKYRPSKFHGLIYKMPECTMNIYSNGSVLCTGAKDTDTALRCIEILVDKVRNCGFDVSGQLNFKVGNRVGSFVLSESEKNILEMVYVNEEVFNKLASNNVVIYEPCRFCGVTWYAKNGTTIIAFRTGRCIVTGCKTPGDQQNAIKEFRGER